MKESRERPTAFFAPIVFLGLSHQSCKDQCSTFHITNAFCPQVFRQNKRATDVHDILGFRIIVSPRPPPDNHASMAAASREASTTTSPEDHSSGHQSVDSAGSRGKGGFESNEGKSEGARRDRKGGGSTTSRSVVAVKAFSPPYRDSDSRLLHDVYEVLVGLFDEVPERFKVRFCDVPAGISFE